MPADLGEHHVGGRVAGVQRRRGPDGEREEEVRARGVTEIPLRHGPRDVGLAVADRLLGVPLGRVREGGVGLTTAFGRPVVPPENSSTAPALTTAAELEDAEQRAGVLSAVGQREEHALLLAHAQSPQRVAEPVGEPVDLGVGEVAVRQPVARPGRRAFA